MSEIPDYLKPLVVARANITPPVDFEEWLDHVVAYSRDAASQMPGDDFGPPFLACSNPAGGFVVFAWTGPVTDDLGEEVFPAAIRAADATRWAWASSMWLTTLEPDSERTEAVQITAGEWTGAVGYALVAIERPAPDVWQLAEGELVRAIGQWGPDRPTAGMMVDDNMRAVQGMPTSREYDACIKRISELPVIQAKHAAAAQQVAGLTLDQLDALTITDPDRALEVSEKSNEILLADPEYVEALRAALSEHMDVRLSG